MVDAVRKGKEWVRNGMGEVVERRGEGRDGVIGKKGNQEE